MFCNKHNDRNRKIKEVEIATKQVHEIRGNKTHYYKTRTLASEQNRKSNIIRKCISLLFWCLLMILFLLMFLKIWLISNTENNSSIVVDFVVVDE